MIKRKKFNWMHLLYSKAIASAVILIVGYCSATHAFGSEEDWPDAIAELSAEKSRATSCVGLIKKYGSEDSLRQGRDFYIEARTEANSVISGLIVALYTSSNPDGLTTLHEKLGREFVFRVALCALSDLTVKEVSEGSKGFLSDSLKVTIPSLIKAATSIFDAWREDDALKKETIKTQLETLLWPEFDSIKPAQ